MVRKKDNPPCKGNSKEVLQRNYFLKTDFQLGKTRRDSTLEEFSNDDPIFASQSLLSHPINGITIPHTPNSNYKYLQFLLRKIETSPSTAWPTIPPIMKSPEVTQHTKKTKTQHQAPGNKVIQMDIDSDSHKIKQAEKDANNYLRIERIMVEEIPALKNLIIKQQALVNRYQEINPQHTICSHLMIDVRGNELKVEALKDEFFRIGPFKESNCTHHKLNEDIKEKNQNPENPFKTVPQHKAAKPRPPNDAQNPIQTKNSLQSLIPDAPEIPVIILKIAENYNFILQEMTQKFPGTNNTLFRENIKISSISTEDRDDIIKLLHDKKKQEFILYEPIAERPINTILKGIHASTPQEYIKQELQALNFEVTKMIQFKNFKEQSLYPIFQVDIKRSPQAQKTFIITHLFIIIHYFKITVESPRRRSTATICRIPPYSKELSSQPQMYQMQEKPRHQRLQHSRKTHKPHLY
ncbi:hypothetical protein AVEN_219311-1 [Araneus ventricosus]|uniref:Pre-C2HC domain-containing protein n=1 Tax=Araneus ventricosus TaxID=182803 RepID=A0A4Y2BEE3_ARAVE|nr:hypothetical protein AVEN_219311-1 [Araneus ventricosus]